MRSDAFLMALTLSLTSGCIVVADDNDPAPRPVNVAPYVNWADAGCYYDSYYNDFIWWFETEVWDDNGAQDVVAVYADVYDARGTFVETFQLFPEGPTPQIWFSDWLQYSTYLDCYYSGYQIDIVAYDSFDAYDAVTIRPATF